MNSIYLVRHGQASFGATNYDQLSELGVRQSLLLGKWMRQTQQPVDKLVMGRMQRHCQSAEAFVDGFGSPEHLHPQYWTVQPGFNEFDHEQFVSRTRPEFADPVKLLEFLAQQEQPRIIYEKMFSEGLMHWVSGVHDADYVESWNAFQTRVRSAIETLANAEIMSADSHNTIVFTSAGPISAVCKQFLAIPDTHLMPMLSVMLNSSVSKLICRDGQFNLSAMNTVAHLEQHNDPSLLSYR